MDKSDIERYLQMVGEELAAKGQKGKILLVGGAVMILIVGNRNSTRDIDGSFEDGAQAIREAVSHVAAREGLPADWLNDGAKGFLYSQPPVTLWRDYLGLEIYLPSLDYLLAMKIVAGRDQDIEDAKALIWKLGILKTQEVLEVLEKYIPVRLLTPRVQYTVEDLFVE
ncbi:MAG TPA: DUF6036 family nucleotidyltransferase [Ktedonobacteraceae bacterium]|nr:DUF6036 family nucleotidyltransferase [Ktedonobacteraceae bacterium]